LKFSFTKHAIDEKQLAILHALHKIVGVPSLIFSTG